MHPLSTSPSPSSPSPSVPFRTKGDLTALLTSKLTLNEHELTDGIFRTDLLPTPDSITYIAPPFASNPQLSDPDSRSHSRSVLRSDADVAIDAFVDTIDKTDPNNFDSVSLDLIYQAYEPLSYAEGYPTQANGLPFWERLPFEPPEAYIAFQRYLEQGNESARQIHILADTPAPAPHGIPEENGIPEEKEKENPDLKELSKLMEWANLYYWRLRCRAFDLFQVAFQRHLKVKRAIQFNDDSYITSLRLANIAETYLTSAAFAGELNPKIALETLRLSQQMGRDALGLTKTGNNGKNSGGPTEVTIDIKTELRRLGVDPNDANALENLDPKILKALEKRGISIDTLSGNIIDIDPETGEVQGKAANSNDTTDILQKFLESEELAKVAQDLILKVSVTSNSADQTN